MNPNSELENSIKKYENLSIERMIFNKNICSKNNSIEK